MLNKTTYPYYWLMVSWLWLVPVVSQAQSFHQDIEVRIADQRLATDFCKRSEMCSIFGIEFLGLPEGQLPHDHLTGQPIYVTQFVNFPGVIAIDSPGFFASEGDLGASEIVRYQASGHLAYWSPALQRWTLAPQGTQIRLAGGLDLQPDQSCGLVFCPPKGIVGFTSYGRKGIGGAPSLIVGERQPNGTLHTHLDWFLESDQGTPGGPAGAYMVEMRLFSEQHPVPSELLYILFNHALPDDEFQQAVTARVLQPSIDPVRTDKLFGWAEANFPDLFPHAANSFIALGYYARCYQNGVCMGVKDDHIFATGGAFGTGIVEVGELTALLNQTGL
jgi:hypothetical protein